MRVTKSLLPKKRNPFDMVEQGLVDLSKGFIPAVDVYQRENAVIVETPLAGVDPKDVEVTVEGAVLTLRGKTVHRKEVDEKDYLYKEVRYGAFQRKIALPATVVGDKAQATSEHGMLRITIPKAKDATDRPVKVGVQKK
jgi:HSP20 family protein